MKDNIGDMAMRHSDLPISIPETDSQAFVVKLTGLYAKMDKGYETIAGNFGFVCQGCVDNCCTTRFYHHTWLEMMVLLRAYSALPSSVRTRIGVQAQDVVRLSKAADARGDKVRQMCPLNFDHRCSLYAERPMICRLHGIPHEFHRPDGRIIQGPGCGDFDQRCGQPEQAPLDRTPFYRQLAELEKIFKKTIGTSTRVKLTIAQMLTDKTPLLKSWREPTTMV